MSVVVNIDTSQVEVLENFFNELSKTDQRKVFRAAYQKATKPLVEVAKSIVPRRTGRLASSIGTIFLNDDITVMVGAKKRKGWHGHLLENGTKERFRKKKSGGGATGKINGVHFMEQSYEQTKDQINNAIGTEWLNAIDRLIQRTIKAKKK